MISIIIPVYNTERYLAQCIRSCLDQSFKDFELILVNDASTDSSLDVCKTYASLDYRVSIINKPMNEGVDKARFSGLERAKGEYVTFIDSDDWLNGCDVLRVMYEKAEETGADYVEIGMQRVMDRYKLIKKQESVPLQDGLNNPTCLKNITSHSLGSIFCLLMCVASYTVRRFWTKPG